MAEGMREDPDVAAMLAFRMRPYGLSLPYEVYKATCRYSLAGVAERIRCPMLITDPEGEAFWPGQSRQLYDALTCPKTLLRFTADEGGDLHCEPKAPALRAQRIFRLAGRDLELCGRPLAAP